MAAIRSNAGGQLLNQYLVARIFAFDDDQSEARAACVAKGWDSVRRGPAWIAYASERAARVRPKLLTEAMDFLRDVVPVAEDALGPDHEYTLMLKNDLAVTLACTTPSPTRPLLWH